MKFFFAVMGGNLAPQDRKTSREQRGALFQSSKRNADSSGSLNRCAIQYEVSVSASHLPKHSHLVSATVDETFLLLDATVDAAARKVPNFKVLRGCTRTPFRIMLYGLHSDYRQALTLVLKF